MPSMNEYTKEWNTYCLKIETDKGPVEVKWNDADTLAQWSNIQAGLYLQNAASSRQLFYEHFTKWYQMFWNQRYRQGIFNLKDDAVIMDIGSGVAVIDLILAQYLPKSKFYLLDKEGFEFYPGVYYDPAYPQYHNWSPVIDAIKANNYSPERFTILNQDSEFPEQVDCITSYLSWGWHYPKDVYWNKVKASLKVGGMLVMDIRPLEDRDIIAEITEDMKSEPVLHPFEIKLPKHVDDRPTPDPSKPAGYRAMWIRKG
jgi:hypothetical protein